MEISKIEILTLLAIIIVFILLFPVPMSRSKQELEVTTDIVSFPHQVVKYMQWQVTWKIITIDRQWGPTVGTQTFPAATFHLNWGYGVVYDTYDDGIGFIAEASFYQDSDGVYRITVGSDDGVQLYIDGTLFISQWRDQYYRETSESIMIGPGWHTLTLHYYEWKNAARIYFDVDKSDLFTWQETQHIDIEIPRISNKTVTETVYLSLLEYLMRGGTG